MIGNREILKKLKVGNDGIYEYEFSCNDQGEEIKLRENIAGLRIENYLQEISRHHSIPVMDKEILNFLKYIPKNGSIIDVGGCWGWHWRNLHKHRPDVSVYIVDFVRENLRHAQNFLGGPKNEKIKLVHGDATNLVFDCEVFDGYWSVQTLQHIPKFDLAIKEANRVLKVDGRFASYSLNNQSLIKFLYRLIGLKYHTEGVLPGKYYLARANLAQKKIIQDVFMSLVIDRYSEIIFKPEFKFHKPGREGSLVGNFDALLSNDAVFGSSFARQHSFHVSKI